MFLWPRQVPNHVSVKKCALGMDFSDEYGCRNEQEIREDP